MKKCARTLFTERLILREIQEQDASQIVEWRSDPRVYPYFKSPHALTKAEHLNWYKNVYLTDNNRLDWLCFEASTLKAVGVFSLRISADDFENVEISYLTAPEERRRGFAAEAIRSLVCFAAKVWNARKVTAVIHSNNIPSIRLVQKLGFVFSKTDGQFCVYELYIE